MGKFFSIEDLQDDQPAAEDKSDQKLIRFKEIHDFKLQNVESLVGRLPVPGELFLLWTVNSFNAWTFIPFVINKTGKLDEIVISTYSINKKVINALLEYLDQGRVSAVFILISDSAKYRIPKVVDHLEFAADQHRSFSVRYAWNHSKVTLMKAGDRHFLFEGSGNFSENSRHEQYMFMDSGDAYRFRKKWIMDEIHGRTT